MSSLIHGNPFRELLEQMGSCVNWKSCFLSNPHPAGVQAWGKGSGPDQPIRHRHSDSASLPQGAHTHTHTHTESMAVVYTGPKFSILLCYSKSIRRRESWNHQNRIHLASSLNFLPAFWPWFWQVILIPVTNVTRLPGELVIWANIAQALLHKKTNYRAGDRTQGFCSLWWRHCFIMNGHSYSTEAKHL